MLAASHAEGKSPPASTNAIKHVFMIVLENEDYDDTFGPASEAPYLAHDLVSRGAILTQYHATGHYSLDNYIAMISGQAPNGERSQSRDRDVRARGARSQGSDRTRRSTDGVASDR
jgi:hypothetical protein